ncbi:MAG TPA: hypothetical protein VF411_01155 [Bacteroidia bacterium]
MTFLCLECGYINENNPELVCRPCQTPLDKELYDLLIDYSFRAVQYDYKYRTNYEKQVQESGAIKTKYSLHDPTNEIQWLAAAALSGVAGNFVYDIIKYIAKQIKDRITEKSKTIELEQIDEDTFEIVADEQTLSKFILYIQSYYKGNSKIDKKVSNAIAEEEIVHAMTDGKSEEFMTAIDTENEEERTKKFLEIFQGGAKDAQKLRVHRPDHKQLEKLFPAIKQKRKTNKKMTSKKKKRRK